MPLKIIVNSHDTLEHTACILKKLVERNLSIAIVGDIYTGKTWILEQLMQDLDKRKVPYITSNFGTTTTHGEGEPEYLCIDHPPSPEFFVTARENYPGIPILATFYSMPENKFHVVIELRVDPKSILMTAGSRQ